MGQMLMSPPPLLSSPVPKTQLSQGLQTISFETRFTAPVSPHAILLVVASSQQVRCQPRQIRQWQAAFTDSDMQFSYTNGRLRDDANKRQQLTVHPSSSDGLEWLCQQNPLGAVYLMRADLLTPDKWAQIHHEQHTPAAWLHAIALLAVSKTTSAQRFLFHPTVYRTSLAFEQALYFPNEGLTERVRAIRSDYRVEATGVLRRPLCGETPLVSIILPFRDKPELLRQCLDSVLGFERLYPHFEVIGVDNQSQNPDTHATMRAYEAKSPKIRFISYPEPFNYSAINNKAARQARGRHLLMLNNDIQVLTPDWLLRLVEWSEHPDVGCVGAKLYYPDGRIQHAGVSLVALNAPIHSFKYLGKTGDPWRWTHINRNVSVATGACLMVKRALYEALGGLDEERFAIAFNDVDFCLRVRDAGYRNLVLGSVEATHHESVSRGKTIDAREKREHAALAAKHAASFQTLDPFYSGALDHFSEPFSRVQRHYMVSPSVKRLMATKVPGSTRRLNVYWLKDRRLYCRLTDTAATVAAMLAKPSTNSQG